MATLTKNLFRGQGERNHRLTVTEGRWPTDVDGSVLVVGPDKRRAEGHWFGARGLLEKISMAPDRDGRIWVEHRLIDTPLQRIRRWLPFLFANVAFAEVSPFGVTNLANTAVISIDDRVFVGYDAGRPVEVDPETLDYLTAVGANDEWLQCAPGVLEPLCAVAAHPAADVDEHCLWFVNYSQIAPPDVAAETYLARWDLDGPVHRWRVEGMSPFDSIHDIKVTENHLIFSDLPFVIEPGMFKGEPRQQRNQDHTKLWIVAKADVAATEPGGSVTATEVRIPMPTGHLFADHREVDGLLRVALQHIPLSDLMIAMAADSISHTTGRSIDGQYEGLIAQAVQPSVVGRYEIDPATGQVRSSDLAVDQERLWGGVLLTSDVTRPEARARQRQLWFASMGFDPDLIPEEWWALYGEANDGIVAPAELPAEAVPGSLARIDLESMKVAEVWTYTDGSFPSPPTFVPRVGSDDPDDGYVVVVVHQDGPKEIQIFDASHIEAGPLARASAASFNPSLLLHSCFVPNRVGPRPSRYRVSMLRDVVGAIRGMPGVLFSFMKLGKDLSG